MSQYRGRFAPSPTGPLHFGSLITALGSFLQARANNGVWLVRMEDIDTPRNAPGAADLILQALEAYGLHWDETVWYQSTRIPEYIAALETLAASGWLYDCGCTRGEIAHVTKTQGLPPGIYPGTCRAGLPPGKQRRSKRLLTQNTCIKFNDLIQGQITQNLEQAVGDFIVHRADGLFAYQLAVVVDDAAQHITEIVRGSDLLDSTPRQIHLQRLLNLPTPSYAHLPIVVNSLGQKLSKQTFAKPLNLEQPIIALWQALDVLGQQPPIELQNESVSACLQWAITHWSLAQVAKVLSFPLPPQPDTQTSAPLQN